MSFTLSRSFHVFALFWDVLQVIFDKAFLLHDATKLLPSLVRSLRAFRPLWCLCTEGWLAPTIPFPPDLLSSTITLWPRNLVLVVVNLFLPLCSCVFARVDLVSVNLGSLFFVVFVQIVR